ncbi:MAG: hypothetical protein J0626_09120, partial [Rhodospirillaceae bacterium]|nr:hypothetical protein [Rhodospirillaceae bacterium]
MRLIERALQEVQPHPRPTGKRALHPRRLRMQDIHIVGLKHGILGQQYQQAIRQPLQMGMLGWRTRQIGRGQQITAFGHPIAPDGNQLAQIAVAIAVLRQRNQGQRHPPIRLAQMEMTADQQWQAMLL